MSDAVTVTVLDAAWQGHPVWAITCSACGLVATRLDREAADRHAERHLDDCIARIEGKP